MAPMYKYFYPLLCLMTLIFPGCSKSMATEDKNHDLNNMPTEYIQIVEIVNRIAKYNQLGKKNISFTINAGAYAGFLGSKSTGNEDSFYYYSSLNPYKTYDNADTNEIIRQAKLYGDWNASAYPNRTISISYSSFRVASHEEIACTIAHEIAHVIDSHSFQESLELGEYAGIALGNHRSVALKKNQVSRRFEKLADSQAWVLLNNAGYPRHSCISTLVELHKSDGIGAPTTPDSTHPGFHDRLDALKEFISNYSEDQNHINGNSFEEPKYTFDRDVPMLTFEF